MNINLSNYKRIYDRLILRLLKFYKNTYQTFSLLRKSNGKKILFICGCQRSGTTLLTEIFERDFNSKVYGEFSVLSSQDIQKIRLNPLGLVKEEIERNNVDLIVLKPLVENQNLLQLLEFFKGSKAVWMFRDYKAVSASNINRFGINNGIEDLRPIVENRPKNWRSEKVSDYVRRIVIKFFSEDMDPFDAASLFWFARNSLFFELKLDLNPDVLLIKYEDLVTEPTNIMKRIYQFLSLNMPRKNTTKKIHTQSVNRGNNVNLSDEINSLCGDLYNRMNRIYESELK